MTASADDSGKLMAQRAARWAMAEVASLGAAAKRFGVSVRRVRDAWEDLYAGVSHLVAERRRDRRVIDGCSTPRDRDYTAKSFEDM